MFKKISLLLLMMVLCMSVGLTVWADDDDGDDGHHSASSEDNGQKIYEISEAEELIDFAESYNDGTYTGDWTLVIEADIDLTTEDLDAFESIGSEAVGGFRGVVEGNEHTITLDGSPLFAEITSQSNGEPSQVNDLILDGSVTTNSGDTGSLANTASGCEISNCINYATVIAMDTSAEYGVGGFIGNCELSSSEVIFESCINAGNVTSYGSAVGGIVGYSSAGIYIECENTGDITQYGKEPAGGIVGSFNQTTDTVVGAHISQCSNWGTIQNKTTSGLDSVYYLEGNVGGIAGYTYGQIIEACFNAGTVEGWVAGGIVGKSQGSPDADTAITDCYNLGAVNGYAFGGGICGQVSYVTISNVYNVGIISEDASIVAGPIVTTSSTTTTISSAYYVNVAYENNVTIPGVSAVTNAELSTLEMFGSADTWTLIDGLYPSLTYYEITDEIKNVFAEVMALYLEDIEIGDRSATWKEKDIVIDLAVYTVNDSGYTCAYSLGTGAPAEASLTGSVLTICNTEGSALDAGTYSIAVDLTVNGTTVGDAVEVIIDSRILSIYDFQLDGGDITAANIATLEAAVEYDGTMASLEKTISSDLWSASTDEAEGQYEVSYAFDSEEWIVTLSITPIVSDVNVSEDSQVLEYRYDVAKRTTVVEPLVTDQYYSIPLEFLGYKITVMKDGVTDGCVYESGITFYVREDGTYTYIEYADTRN